MKLHDEARRWFLQADDDLRTVRTLVRGKRYAAACFYAQQAAEKALKAWVFAQNVVPPPVHSLLELIRRCPPLTQKPETLTEAARRLDRFYTQARYPDNLPAPGYPGMYFTAEDAREALRLARRVVTAVRRRLLALGLLSE